MARISDSKGGEGLLPLNKCKMQNAKLTQRVILSEAKDLLWYEKIQLVQTVKGFFGCPQNDNPSTAYENPKPTKERLEDPCWSPSLTLREAEGIRNRKCKIKIRIF